MKTKILGISGKKQSGKNTSANYIVGLWAQALELCDGFSINKQGNLVLKYGSEEVLFDPLDNTTPIYNELKDFIRIYSFADVLKQKVCIEILGLTHEQCYGTDAQKMSLTKLKWEDMPGVITPKDVESYINADGSGTQSDIDECIENKKYNGYFVHEPGLMTAREVMQFIGTEIFRKMYGDVWVDATIRAINADGPLMAIISDVRFPNEVYGTQKHGGLVGRLTKDVFKGQDQHDSETALDDFPLDKYDFVWDNEKLNIEEQNQLVFKSLKDKKLIPHSISEKN